jgi:uncharacterized membrane protein
MADVADVVRATGQRNDKSARCNLGFGKPRRLQSDAESAGPMKRITTWAPSLPDWAIRTLPSMMARARTLSSPWLKMRISLGRRRTRAQAAAGSKAEGGSPRDSSIAASDCGGIWASLVMRRPSPAIPNKRSNLRQRKRAGSAAQYISQQKAEANLWNRGSAAIRWVIRCFLDGRARDDVIVAPALHVLAVVIWIGDVAMATTVALPAVGHGDLGSDKFQAFQAIEHRFAWQARTVIVVVGLTGFYMTWRLDLWDRFSAAAFWWMHAMVCPWLLFTAILFLPSRSFCTAISDAGRRRGRRSPALGCIGRTGCCWR